MSGPSRSTRRLRCQISSLRFAGATLAWKYSGLDAAGLRATLGMSAITLGGLLKHLAHNVSVGGRGGHAALGHHHAGRRTEPERLAAVTAYDSGCCAAWASSSGWRRSSSPPPGPR
ncbi:DUF664 domain-containing protein [Streptomyces sp. YIM 132580]|nr:DUF664 domain-containing protein [Streptomyces sp. YIM 132580]